MPISSRQLVLALVILLGLGLTIASTQTCLRVGFTKGIWLHACPDGDIRQVISVSAPQLKRGAASPVEVVVQAISLVAPNDRQQAKNITRFTPVISLLNASSETVLTPKGGWKKSGGALSSSIELPQVSDGDYILRTRVTSPLGEETLEIPLPLYTPARAHVLTDRPLYEPGNTVQFRAVVLKADDLTPLEGRPGRWRVTNIDGETLMDEGTTTGPWGVVSGSFPLDRSAASGQWTVTWLSGSQSQSRTFNVRPFTLPRFQIEASPSKPFYRRREKPLLKGAVTYSSGAPVAGAKLELKWTFSGSWPPPTSWTDGQALPTSAQTDGSGRFVVELPVVPEDIQGRSTLHANIGAIDASGDRVEGAASILLSEDSIAASAVAEVSDGLLEGFNNRLFVRATTADGRVLENVSLNIKRLWEPNDKGTDADVDEDGVGSFQIDPGPPVNIIIPALPFRAPPRTKPVVRQTLSERLEGNEVSLADRMTFDGLDVKLEPCARFVLNDSEQINVGLLIRSSGAVASMVLPPSKLGRCVENVLKGVQFGLGKERFFEIGWSFNDEDLPRFEVSLDGLPQVPQALDLAVRDALLEARDCLPPTVKSGELPRMLQWTVSGHPQKVDASWVDIKGEAYPESALTCVTSRVRSITLPVATSPQPKSIGVAHLSIKAPEKYEQAIPEDTVEVGYEFLVSARRGKEILGSTKLRMSPAGVPNIRLRASTQLVKPNDVVKVEILRGPEFKGELPEKLFMTQGFRTQEAKFDPESRTATFTIPTDWLGWASVQWGGGQVFLFVQPSAPLTVKVSPERARYAPGQIAHFSIETITGAVGGPAAVGLFGVDESLSQLTPLPDADELATLRLQATGSPAFGSLDAQALSLGRIRGAHAAAATLARVSALPPAPQQDAVVALAGKSTFDPNEAQVDRFYTVLGEFYSQVHQWEATAPAAQKMTPALMAKLWNQSLDVLEAKKSPVHDAWGRKLRLHRLPTDLLALTEPRAVVINGTRLPEDMQNWPQWVAKEKP